MYHCLSRPVPQTPFAYCWDCYGCESWTMTAETTKRVETFETKCFRRMLGIFWSDRKTDDFVHAQVTSRAGPQEPLLATIKRRKLTWFGHVTRHNSLPKTILQGTLEGGRKRGRQAKSWLDNIKEWTRMDTPTLIRKAEYRASWRRLAHSASLMSPLRPQRSGERGEVRWGGMSADQTCYLTQSHAQYTDIQPASPSTDPIMKGTWPV